MSRSHDLWPDLGARRLQIWASSENAIATECLTPEHSRMPGLEGHGARTGLEIVLNDTTIETTAEQYNSVIEEKLMVDPSREDPRFLQLFPSAELTAHWMAPGARPTPTHRRIAHGSLSLTQARPGVAA